jgi:hypothetical protein
MALDTSRITPVGAPINLPFFNTPYVYPDAVSGQGIPMRASGGDFVGLAVGNTIGNVSALGQSGIYNATVTVLTQTKAQRMTVNGGFNPAMFGFSQTCDPGIIVDGSWWWPDLDIYSNPFSATTSQVRLGNVPFADNKHTTSAPTDNKNTPIDLNVSGTFSSEQFLTTVSSNLGRLCVRVVANIGFLTTVDLGVNLRGFIACPNRATDVILAAFYPPLNGFIQKIDPNSADLFLFGNRYFIPDYRNRTNYFWYVRNTAIAYRRVDANIDILSGGIAVNPSATVYQLVTSDPTLNADIAAGQCNMYGVSNGLILYDTVTGKDYFVTSDGSGVYPLNYINYGTVKAIPLAQSPSPYTLNIDTSGVAYYTGNSTVVGSVLQPLFSVGFNIPFNPVILPQIPPIAWPCWDPCLGRIGGAPGQLNLSNSGGQTH